MTEKTEPSTAAIIKSVVERVERLEEEKSGLSQDIKEIYSEAKSKGLDVKTIRALVRLRKIEAEKRKEAAALLDTYARAIQLDLGF